MLCEKCGHLQGTHEDTDEFCESIYTKDSGSEYAKDYLESDSNSYNHRVAQIYIPKAEFMYTSLVDSGVNPHSLSYLDYGAGSGFFVSALAKVGLRKVEGTEVSKNQVEFGNRMIESSKTLLKIHNLQDTKKVLSETSANVVSMIGVLEHLQSPREALLCLKNNKNVDFFYMSVPTFSFSVFLEILSDKVFHRQLHGDHTHLYTEKSIAHLCKEFGFEIVSQWNFGSDIMDLYRHVSVTLDQKKCSAAFKNEWRQQFTPMIDMLQLEMDKKHLSSEVHLLLKKI